ncbi:MAG: TIGR00645 family protein [Gammaproteobacteria bacterium]
MQTIERLLENLLFTSRWLLAPFYLGLVGAIVVLLWYFGVEFVHLVAILTHGGGSVVVGVLALVDLVLVANLLIIIIFAGYENFVSKIDTGGHEDRPDWMGHVDFAGLKMKLIGSIIAISGIDLLKAFVAVGDNISNEQLAWKVGIHVTFVFSGLMFAIMDWLGGPKKHGAGG